MMAGVQAAALTTRLAIPFALTVLAISGCSSSSNGDNDGSGADAGPANGAKICCAETTGSSCSCLTPLDPIVVACWFSSEQSCFCGSAAPADPYAVLADSCSGGSGVYCCAEDDGYCSCDTLNTANCDGLSTPVPFCDAPTAAAATTTCPPGQVQIDSCGGSGGDTGDASSGGPTGSDSSSGDSTSSKCSPCWPNWACLTGNPNTSTTLSYFQGVQRPNGSCTLTGGNNVTTNGQAFSINLECDGKTSQGGPWTYGNVPSDPQLGMQVQFSVDGLAFYCGAT